MNKTVLITGASRGIGNATEELIRLRGWQIIAPSRDELDFCRNDVDTFLLSPIDAMILCHGAWDCTDFREQCEGDWEWQLYLRVIYPATLIRRFLIAPSIKMKSVVMVASTRGFIGGVNTGPYAAACAAQIAMMTGYAREYEGVRFNVVCPGLTDTDMGAEVIQTGGAKPNDVPQPREVVAMEIVRLIEGDDNGKVIRVVDGKASEAKWSW